MPLFSVTCISGTDSAAEDEPGSLAGLTSMRARRRAADSSYIGEYDAPEHHDEVRTRGIISPGWSWTFCASSSL